MYFNTNKLAFEPKKKTQKKKWRFELHVRVRPETRFTHEGN